MKLYGNLPIDLGMVGENINCDEMMFYLYLPISYSRYPYYTFGNDSDRLRKFIPLIHGVYDDLFRNQIDVKNKYIYLTVKTLHVSPGCFGQRPGWHSDGFMTDDINYIWYTDNPTIFYKQDVLFALPQDHEESLGYMEICEDNSQNWVTYPNKHLLRLDESVIHKPNTESSFTGVRTFVKISVSDNIYAHKGNSINSLILLDVEYTERSVIRNSPVTHSNKRKINDY